MRAFRVAAAVVAAIVLVLAGAAGLRQAAIGGAPVAAAQTAPAAATPLAAITVTGEGTATAAPDVAYLSLGVETSASTAKAAADANSSAMNAVIAAVKADGVADKNIQTSGYNIQPVYAQGPNNQGGNTVTGYRVQNTVSVTVDDLSTVSKVLDDAVKAGANSDVGIRFAIKDTTALEKQALAAAMQQATAKAGALATAAGVKLGGVYNVTEQTTSSPRPVAQAAAAVASAPAATPIEQGQLTVQATVQAVFSYTR